MRVSNTSKRLKEIMHERNLRQVDILELTKPYSDKLGVRLGKNDLSQYLSGKYEPKQDKLTLLSKALGVSETWLMGYDVPVFNNIKSVKYHRIPKLGCTAAGIPNSAEYDDTEYVDIPIHIKADYCLDIHGSSMEPLIKDGDIVFFRYQNLVDNGEIAVVMIDNEATLKRFYKYNHNIQLVAINPNFPTIIIEENDTRNIRIVGKAVSYYRQLKNL